MASNSAPASSEAPAPAPAAAAAASSSGGPMSKFLYSLRFTGGLCGVALIILGILGLLASAFNPQSIINGVYQIIFGVLAIIAELRLAQVLKHFKFLTHFLGLGLFYIFIGGLALGGEWYEILVAVVVLSVGILYCFLGCLCRKFGQEDFTPKRETEPVYEDDRQPVLSNEVPSDAFEYQPPMTRDITEDSENSMTRSSSSSKAWQTTSGGAYGGNPASSTTVSEVRISSNTARVAASVAGYNLSSSQSDQAASAATAVANNPYARTAGAAAARSAFTSVASGASTDEIKKNAVESAVHSVNPFADFH